MQILKANNGLTVLFKPMQSRLVDIKYFVRCGAINETSPEQNGVCHALEHMVYAGTTTRTWEQILKEWDAIGAYYNAYTAYDHTTYEILSPGRYFEEAFVVLADVVHNNTLPEDRWEDIEKNAVISEIQDYDEDSSSYLEEKLFENALGKKYHRILGGIPNIRKMNIDLLRNFRNDFYCGENIFLVVSGDITPSRLMKIVNKYDNLNPKKPKPTTRVKLNFNKKTLSLRRPGEEQVNVQLLKPLAVKTTPREKIKTHITAQLFNNYLFKEIRERRGLSYGIEAGLYEDVPNHTYLHITTFTDRERLRTFKRELFNAIKDFPSQITTTQIHEAKMSYLRTLMVGEENVSDITNCLGNAFLAGIKKDPFEINYSVIETLGERAINNFIKEHYSGDFKLGQLLRR